MRVDFEPFHRLMRESCYRGVEIVEIADVAANEYVAAFDHRAKRVARLPDQLDWKIGKDRHLIIVGSAGDAIIDGARVAVEFGVIVRKRIGEESGEAGA